jgi:hypothetical protein
VAVVGRSGRVGRDEFRKLGHEQIVELFRRKDVPLLLGLIRDVEPELRGSHALVGRAVVIGLVNEQSPIWKKTWRNCPTRFRFKAAPRLWVR